eukprot:6117798-Alexandrium_andersonii.AAC.1
MQNVPLGSSRCKIEAVSGSAQVTVRTPQAISHFLGSKSSGGRQGALRNSEELRGTPGSSGKLQR